MTTTLAVNKTPERKQTLVNKDRRDRYQRTLGLVVIEFECDLIPYNPATVGFYRSNLEHGRYYCVIAAQTVDGFFNRAIERNQPHFFSTEEDREKFISKRIKDWSKVK
jgi:hypothetical protein